MYLEFKGALLSTVGAWWDVASLGNANVADIERFRVGELILHTRVSTGTGKGDSS